MEGCGEAKGILRASIQAERVKMKKELGVGILAGGIVAGIASELLHNAEQAEPPWSVWLLNKLVAKSGAVTLIPTYIGRYNWKDEYGTVEIGLYVMMYPDTPTDAGFLLIAHVQGEPVDNSEWLLFTDATTTAYFDGVLAESGTCTFYGGSTGSHPAIIRFIKRA